MAYIIFVLVVGVISHAFSQGVNDYETAAWISKIGNSNNGRQFMINQKYDRASTETSILKRDNINTMVDSTRKGDDVLEKRFLDPVSSVEAKDVSCVLDDGESGVCVFYYQCNVTTHVVITDGSSILSKRQKGCSNNLHVCCKDNNLKELNNNTVMIEQTYTSDNNVHKDEHHDGLSKSSDPFINGHPFKGGTELNLDPVQEDDNYTLCISDEGESGVCVFYFQCNVTTRVVITDGSDIINARQRACPDILRVCCNRHYLISSTETTTANMDDDNNENPIKLTPVKYSNEEKRKNNIGPYTLGSSLTFIHNDSKPTQEVTEINLDPIDIKKDDDVSCVLDDGGSGVCVFYYQCNVTTHVVITDGSSILNPRQRRCPSILQVCCKENKSKSTMAITNTTTSNIKHDSGKRPTLTNFSSIVTSNNKYEHNQNFESSTIYALPTFAQTMQKNTIKPPIEVTEINLDPIDAQDGDVQCVRDDGASGVCVFYYQCTAHGVVTDGSGIINFRQGRCPSILQVCCKKNNLKSSKEITSDKGKNNTYSTVPTSDITINIVDQLMKNKESHFSTMPAHQVSHTNLHSKGARDYDVSCVLDDGESGVCVFYDQCNVITDGFSILRSRTGRCSSILYICCKNNHINSHHETSPLNTESLRVRYYKHLMQLTSTNSNNNNNVDWHKRSTRLSNIDDLSPNIDTLESKTNNTDELKDTKLDSVVFRDDDDWSCVLDDGESGVCVFYYQCNVTRVVITDGSHIINAKRKCPSILQVCCEQNDIKTSTRISDTTKANAEDKYKDTTGGADVMPEIDLDPVTSPDDPLCETDNGEIGFCVMYYQCESTNRTLIKDGSTIINFRRKSCPNYLEVCCTENATPPQEIMEMSISKEIGSPLNGKTNTNDLMGNKSNEGTSTYIHISFYLFTILFLCFI